jgi:Asp-tRNA(Asn)/Glu-tRNA(Gln) amidotransferase A subunit family amidase
MQEVTIGQVHEALRNGEFSARELTEAYLGAMEAQDGQGPALNAVVSRDEGALERADELDEALRGTGELSGSLHGIPVLVKDCIETQDVPTSFGSEVFADYRPKADATVVRNLRESGAIILAKTTLPDFATS